MCHAAAIDDHLDNDQASVYLKRHENFHALEAIQKVSMLQLFSNIFVEKCNLKLYKDGECGRITHCEN